MATRNLTLEDHGVVELSALVATNWGAHIVQGRAPEDIDDGSFVSIDSFDAGDVWNVKAPVLAEGIYLVASSPLIYEDFTKAAQEERRFFNAKGDVMRCYQLVVRDRFALSKEAFAEDAEPAVGKYLDVKGYKAGITDTAPTEGPVMKIYDTTTAGNFRVVVEKI